LNAEDALGHLLTLDFKTVLDLGSGEGLRDKIFREKGKSLTTCSLIPPADYVLDYLETDFPQFDCIWASHVLEHQLNVNFFLKKCFSELKDNGIFAVTVPPLKHEIVGGHVTLWNQGLLLYNLILAGFDCKLAWVKTYGYNISVVVRKKSLLCPDLVYDYGDINKLAQFFPYSVTEGFNGNTCK